MLPRISGQMPQPTELNLSIGPNAARFLLDDANGRDYVVRLCQKQGFAFYEVPLPTILMALAQEATGAFLDIGANTGPYALLAAAANPRLDVYAFEPVPSVRRQLERNIALNPTLASRIHVIADALSDRTGAGVIHEHVNHDLIPTSSTIEEGAIASGDSKRVEISLSTLDDWMAARDRPTRVDLMKIDVEGHEHRMFAGAEATIAHHRPVIVVELLGSADFAFFEAFLKRHNYMDIALYPGEAKATSHLRFIGESWNHVFCPAERGWQFALTCIRTGLPIGAETAPA